MADKAKPTSQVQGSQEHKPQTITVPMATAAPAAVPVVALTAKELWAQLQTAQASFDLKKVTALTAQLQKLQRDSEQLAAVAETGARAAYCSKVQDALQRVVVPAGLLIKGSVRRTDTGLDDVSAPIVTLSGKLLDYVRHALAVADAPTSLKGFTYELADGKPLVVQATAPAHKGGVGRGGGAGKGEALTVDGNTYTSASAARKAVMGEVNPETGSPWSGANRNNISAYLKHKGHTVA